MRFLDEPPLVYCVIVNWNGWKDTVACLESLTAQDYPRLQVIVVDNGSTNDSVDQIRQAHPWVALVETGRNLGFPRGCNVGTRLAVQQGADFIWLLNNDTTAPPDTTTRMMRAARANPQAGAIGSVLYYMDNPAQVQAWGGGRMNRWFAYVSHLTSPTPFGPDDFITGASMLLPRSICEEIGIFYEGFFMYCDDADLCFRLHRAGYSLAIADDTAILHKEGGSSTKRNPAIDGFATTSTMRMLRRNAPVPAISISLYLTMRILNRIRKGEWPNLAAVARGIKVFFQEFNVVFSDRL
jgi:GT2 family glycosyltransferase